VSGAAAFVTQAAARFPLAIVSGALRGEIEHALSLAGLRDHFAVIVAAEDVTACKPDPQGYEAARDAILERGTGAATRCVVIEDSLPGLEAARRAGMPCAMLTTSHPRTALGDADLVWDSFAGHDPRELEHLLQS
jgi:HAD superfamily hydrolase (TIGR01509 family)